MMYPYINAPSNIATMTKTLSVVVLGTMSPYPIVVIVIAAQ